jgi:hypothetical protein
LTILNKCGYINNKHKIRGTKFDFFITYGVVMKYLKKLLLCIFSWPILFSNIYAGPENIEAFKSLFQQCLPKMKYAQDEGTERFINIFIRPMLAQVTLMTDTERKSVGSDIETLKGAITTAPDLSSENRSVLMTAVTEPVSEEEVEAARSSLISEPPVRTPATTSPLEAAAEKRRAEYEEIRRQADDLKDFVTRHIERCDGAAREIGEQYARITRAEFEDSRSMLTAVERSIGQSMKLLGGYIASYDQRKALIAKTRHLITIIEQHLRDDKFELFISRVIQQVRDLVEPLFIDPRLLKDVLSYIEALQGILLDWTEYKATTRIFEALKLRDTREKIHPCVLGLLNKLVVVIMGGEESRATGRPSPVPAFAWDLFRQSIESSQVLITMVVSDSLATDRFLIEEVIPRLITLISQSFERLEDWQHTGETSGDVRVTSGLFETFVNFYVTATGTIVSHFIERTQRGEVSPEDYEMYTHGLFGWLQNSLEILYRYSENPVLRQLLRAVRLPGVAGAHFGVLARMHDLDTRVVSRPEASLVDFCQWIQNSRITAALGECSTAYPAEIRTQIDSINQTLSGDKPVVRAGTIDTVERLVLATIILLQSPRNSIADTLTRLHDKFDRTHFNILEIRGVLGGQSPNDVIGSFADSLIACGFHFTVNITMDTSEDEEVARRTQAELDREARPGQ